MTPVSNNLHRLFHPLCGSDLVTLISLLARNGPPSLKGLLPVSIALTTALCRTPFTAAERVWMRPADRNSSMLPPVFIVGHMRSGTTHLHNLLAASGCFTTVPPLLAAMPWEAFSLVRLLRPLVERHFPEHRFIDNVSLRRDSPTEDEIALANMVTPSYYHAFYFPARFERNYYEGLFPDGEAAGKTRLRYKRIAYYARKMARISDGRPLLLKNPAYTTCIGTLKALWPSAKFIHIYRDPYVVFESTKRAFKIVLRELSLQARADIPLEDIILDTYPRIMQRLLKQAHALSREDLVHVRFEDLEAEPVNETKRIFRVLGLENFVAARPRIAAYVDGIDHYQKNTYVFAPEDVDRVSHHWRPFIARWGYRAPSCATSFESDGVVSAL
jgi:hypothetical protein